eukprot:469929_1
MTLISSNKDVIEGLNTINLTLDNVFDQIHEDKTLKKNDIKNIKLSDLNIKDKIVIFNKYICNICYKLNCNTECYGCGAGGHESHLNADDEDYWCNNCL